jgi:hypothetical protein
MHNSFAVFGSVVPWYALMRQSCTCQAAQCDKAGQTQPGCAEYSTSNLVWGSILLMMDATSMYCCWFLHVLLSPNHCNSVMVCVQFAAWHRHAEAVLYLPVACYGTVCSVRRVLADRPNFIVQSESVPIKTCCWLCLRMHGRIGSWQHLSWTSACTVRVGF